MYGTRPASERVATYLEIANMKNPNIRIDVRIYATDNNPQSQLGVDWSSMLTPGLTFGIQPPGTSINSTSSTTSTGGTNSSAFPTFNSLAGLVSSFGHPGSALVMQNQLQATLNFFVNETRAEAITEPSSITANDREVAFAATQQIPYVSGSEVAGNGYGTRSSSGYNQTASISFHGFKMATG
jgi:type II secretory pathway component GspD/PulD (secretin)